MLEPSGFREIARSATVTYPIPFAFAALLAFAVLTLGGAILAGDALRWVLAGLGGVSFLVAVAMLVGCAVWKPELLRSERHEIRNRIVDLITDSDLGPDVVEVTRLVLEDDGVKKAAVRNTRASTEGGTQHGDR